MPAAHRRGQRAFDADEIILERLDGVVRQPVVEFLEGRLARENSNHETLRLPP
jgi:hypothetical protein